MFEGAALNYCLSAAVGCCSLTVVTPRIPAVKKLWLPRPDLHGQ